MLRGAHAGFDSNVLPDGAWHGLGIRARGQIPGRSESKRNLSKNFMSEERNKNTGYHESKRQHQQSIQRAELIIDRKLLVLTVQKRTVHKLLIKIEEMIDTKSLFLALEILFECSIQDSMDHTVSQSEYIKHPSNTSIELSEWYIQSPLMTDAGFAVVACFSSRILLGQLDVSKLNKQDKTPHCTTTIHSRRGSRSSHECDSSSDMRDSVNIMKSSAEIFHPLLEVIEGSQVRTSFPDPSQLPSSSSFSTSFPTSLSSSSSSYSSSVPIFASSSSLQSASLNQTSVPSQPKTLNSSTLLSSFLSLVPLLYFHEENLRKSAAMFNTILSPQTPMKRLYKEDQNASHSKQSNHQRNSVFESILPSTKQNFSGTDYNASGSKNGEKNNRENIDLSINGSPSVLNGLLGGAVDRSGCAVLLLISYCLFDYAVLKIRKKAEGDIFAVAKDQFLNEIIIKMKANLLISRKENKNGNLDTYNNNNNNDSNLSNDEEKQKLKILILYDIIENQVLNVQDITLAVCGLKLLISMSQFTMLSHRIASVSWTLLLTLHTQRTVLSTHLINQINMNCDSYEDIDFLPGTDALWPYLVSYESTSICSSLDIAINEITNISLLGHGLLSLKMKAIKAALTAFQSTFNISYNKNKQKDSIINVNNIQSFKIYWISWWNHESPTFRIFGVINLLSEIFRFYNLPVIDHSMKIKEKNNKSGKRLSKNSNINSLSSSSTSSTTSSSNSSSIPIEKSSFPSLSMETSETLFLLALNSFPAIFILAEPQPYAFFNSFYYDGPRGVSGANLNLELFNPFQCFIDICKSYIRFLHQLEELIDDGAQMRFIIRTSSSCVRTARAVLLCMEARVVCSVAWRNEQPVRDKDVRNDKAGKKGNKKEEGRNRESAINSFDSDTETDEEIDHINDDNSSDNDSDSDDNCHEKKNYIADNNDVDLGSVEFLANMLDWSLALTHGVIRYSEILKSKLLHPKNGFEIPRYVLDIFDS